MNNNSFKKQGFETSFSDNVAFSISELTDQYFELFKQYRDWFEKKNKLDFEYKDFTDVPSHKKIGWFFLLFVLTPLCALFDYASISSFITYLGISTGSKIMGTIMSIVGWLFFVLLELAIGWLIIYAKEKPILKVFGYVLAAAMIFVPSYLIYTTYDITPEKTSLLYHKTIALIVVSAIIHVLFFLCITEIWNAISYYVYTFKNNSLRRKRPSAKMQKVKYQLQQLYPHLNRQIINMPVEQLTVLLHNRAWYLKSKLSEGNTGQEYDLSDYNSSVTYVPKLIGSSNHAPIGFQNVKN